MTQFLHAMEEEISAGNPCAAPSNSLPVQPRGDTVEGADWIRTPLDSGGIATPPEPPGPPSPLPHKHAPSSSPEPQQDRPEGSCFPAELRVGDGSGDVDRQGTADHPELGPSDPPTATPLSGEPMPTTSPVTLEAYCEENAPPAAAAVPAGPKLCGYLHKQGGPLKTWKLRWFSYEEKKSQLFYFRTSQDITPLSHVELDCAIFSFPLKGEPGTFHIETPERTFILKAANQEARMYWLQQLQLRRWQYRERQSGSPFSFSDPTTTTNNNNSTACCPGEEFLPVVKIPPGLVGEEAANLPAPFQRTTLTNVSIKHPLIEIQNSLHILRSKHSSQDLNKSIFFIDAPPWTPAEDDTPPTTAVGLVSPEPATEPVQHTPGEEKPSLSPHRHKRSVRDRLQRTRVSSTLPVLHRKASAVGTSCLLQEKHILVEEVKAQKELVWLLHKALEAAQLEKRTCAEFVAAEDEQERLELLRHRERQAADLRGQMEELRAEVEELRGSLEQRDAYIAELKDNLKMLMEKNMAKQEVILKLSDQVDACMADPQRIISSSDRLELPTVRQLQNEMENLRDDIDAYKTQNKFLNSEIYQLTKLWRRSSEQERTLIVKCVYLEANNCQVESRYLGILQKMQENKSLTPDQREAIKQFIEDAVQGDLKTVFKLNPVSDQDEYGFQIIPDYEVEDMKLMAKIQALEIRSHNLLQQEAGDRHLLGRWAQYLSGRSDEDLYPSMELKNLLRAGIPREYRQRLWLWVVRARTRSTRERYPNRYEQLCEKSRKSPHPASRQIQLDLHRTLITNQHFSSPSSPALQKLQRILLAFSWQNPAIGYCQGLNRLAAIALLILQTEEDAFWCLLAVVESIMPQDYYTQNLVASQADQRVLKDFMVEKLPRLASHFEEHNIDVSLITFNWFLVVFVDSLPSDILFRVWDAFLYEGTKVLFRYALALFKYKEDDILKIHNSIEICQYLRFFPKTITDSRKLTSIAFSEMNPFPGRLLRNRRALHLERLQGELKELEEQQRQFVTESTECKDKDLSTMVSEDDDEP